MWLRKFICSPKLNNAARAFAALSLTSYCAAALATSLTDSAKLRDDLERLLKQEELSGLVYSIVDSTTTDAGALGFASVEKARPLRADAKVHVGSIAKTLVSLGVLHLATRGVLDLDAPISKYMSQPSLENRWAHTTPVTLR
jgi:CubicO group peptidase (beta-lactamase class C family)